MFALDEVRARGWTENADRLAEMNATRLGVDNSLYLALHTGPLAETR